MVEEKAITSFWRAIDFLVRQFDNEVRAWSTEPGGLADPWTTGEIIWLLNSVSQIPREPVDGGVTYLLDSQHLDGSWGSTTYLLGSDVPASAYGTISLLETLGPDNLAAQRALDWLVESYRRGWTTVPRDPEGKFQGTHFYSTSMALRALTRAPPQELRSMCIQDSISGLLAAQNEDGGWGFTAGRQSDPTFTSYVLHGIVDAAMRTGANQERKPITAALTWLLSVQSENGTWRDWHGVEQSPEATGYAVYSLLRSSGTQPDERIVKAVNWLIEQQQDDGGWLFDPTTSIVSNNWVTFSVILGLRAYITRLSLAQKATSLAAYVNTDAEPVDRPESAAFVIEGTTFELPRYQTWFPDQLRDLPLVRALDHTMFEAVDIYVKQRLPEKAINDVVAAGGKIELHQIYPDDFLVVAPTRNWNVTEEITGFSKPKDKLLNRIRPRFFRGTVFGNQPRLWAAITPGHDYLYHYALMTRHLISLRTVEAKRHTALYRYPLAERQLVEWTQLSNIGLAASDIIFMGYVEEVEQDLLSLVETKALGSRENAYYRYNRFSCGPNQLGFLGVKFSFWGSMSGLIVQALCKAKCRQIIYIGKLGALTSPADIYQKIFSPSRFFQLRHVQLDFEEPAPPNPILLRYPDLSSGVHVSVPTVLEEDYVQRGKATELAAQSIDNEIAVMASAVGGWNRAHSGSIGFSCLHFATDYIRRPTERIKNIEHDLGKDKTEEARRKKRETLRRIVSEIVAPYLTEDLSRA